MDSTRINKATVKRWIDGDTVEVTVHKRIDLDFGFISEHNFPITVRVRGLDTPEMRGDRQAEGVAAKQMAERMSPPGTSISLISHRVKSFDRYIADITLPDGADYACMMRDAGHHTGKYE